MWVYLPDFTGWVHGAWPCQNQIDVAISIQGLTKHMQREKGMRDRNSPTCTLNQNGYGVNHSQHSIEWYRNRVANTSRQYCMLFCGSHW